MSARTALVAALGVAMLILLLLAVSPGGPFRAQPAAVSQTPTAPATTAPPTQTPGVVAGCDNAYQQGDVPVVPPRTAGQFLRVAIDRVVVLETIQRTNWAVRFFVPSNAPGSAEIPLQAQITDAAGKTVPVMPEYLAAPPNAGSGPVIVPITLIPCGSPRPSGSVAGSVIVLIIQSSPIATGRYTLTLGPAKLPEGGTRAEVFEVSLTCDARPAPVGGVCR